MALLPIGLVQAFEGESENASPRIQPSLRYLLLTCWKGVDEALDRFGLPADPKHRGQIRQLLVEQIQKQIDDDDDGDQSLMRLLCAQLFSIGNVEDALIIWQAK